MKLKELLLGPEHVPCEDPIETEGILLFLHYYYDKSKSLIWRPKHIQKLTKFGMRISRGVNLGILGFVAVGGSKWLGHAP